jgi:chemotaxis protein CheC
MELHRLDAVQLDGLTEVANVGAGHAATALSELIGRRVTLRVPQVRIIRLEELDRAFGSPDLVVAAVMMRILGDITGRTVQIFDAGTAVRLAALLLDRPPAAFPVEFGAAERSVLNEVSNIITGAYLNALSEFTGVFTMVSVPALAIDTIAAVLLTSYVNFGDVDDHVFSMSTRLELDGEADGLRAEFLLLPDRASLEVILRSIRLA